MKDIYKTKKQLIKELEDARREISRVKVEKDSAGSKSRIAGQVLNYQGNAEVLPLVSKAIDSTTDAIGLSDPEGRHVYQNRAFSNMFEYTGDELEAAGGVSAIFAVSRIAREVFGSIMSGRSWVGEVEVRAKSGREFDVHLRADAIKNDEGRIVGLVQIFTDITERKRIEYQLKRKNDELQLILDSIPAYVFYKDKAGKMLNINKAATALAYVPREKLLNKTVFDLVPETADRYNRDDMEVITSGQPKTNIEEPLHLPDGERWLKTDKLPVKDDDGNTIGLLGFSVDITDRKKVQDELAQSEALLRSFFDSPGLICGVVEIEDDDIRYITVNSAMAAMYGLTPDEVSNKLAREIGTDGGIVKLFIENYNKSRENNAPEYFEYHREVGGEMRWLYVTATFLGLEPNRHEPRYAFVTNDITERRRAEEALRQSEGKMRSLFDVSPDVVMNIDRQGRILFINRATTRTIEETIGTPVFDYIPPEYRSAYTETIERVFRTGKPETIETRGLGPEKRISWYEARFVALEAENEQRTLMVAATDITARRQAEEALRESETKYRYLAEKMTDIVWMLDMDLNTTYVSPSITRILGYTPEERLVQPVKDQLTPESYKRVVKTLTVELERDGREGVDPDRSAIIEVEYCHKNGSTVWMENVVSAIRDEQGKPVMLHGVSRDITERKKVEEALRESEQKLRWMFESIKEGIFVVGTDGSVLEANAGVEKITGYSREQLLGKSGLDHMFPGFKGDAIGMLEKMIARGGTHREVIIPMKTAAGDAIEVEATSSTLRDSSGNPVGLIGIFRDVSNRKRMENALRDSEEKLRLTFASMADGIVVTDIEGHITDINEAQMRMFGFQEKSELIGRGGFDFLAERERGRALAEMFKVYEEGFNTGSTYTVVDRNGREFECELSTAMLHDADGKPAGTVTVMRDVTERRRMEQTLRESEERYRLLAENSLDAIWTIDMSLKYTFISPAILRIVKGYALKEVQQMSIQELLTPESFSTAVKVIEEELALERTSGIDPFRSRTVELALRNKDGSAVWTEVTASFIRDSDGNVIGVQGSTRDITERRKAELLIRESEERYRLLAENVSDVIWTMDLNLNFTYISPSVQSMRGYTAEEAVKMPLEETVTPDSMSTVKQVLKEEFEVDHTEQYTSRTIEVELKCKDGSTVWTEMKLSWLHDSSGNRIGIMGVTRDITERRKVEEALRETSEKLRVIFDSIGEAVTVVDMNGDIVDANREVLRLHGFNSKEEIIGRKSSELVAFVDRERAVSDAVKSLKAPNLSGSNDYKLVDVTGREFDGEFNVAVIRDERGKPTGFIGIARDISERKRMEEALLRINKAVESSSDAIAISDSSGHHFYHNRAFTELFEFTPEELEAVGGGPAAYASEDVARKVFDTIMSGGSWSGEVEMKSKGGRVFTVLLRADAIKDESGKLIGLIGVHTDITERKKAEAEIIVLSNAFKAALDAILIFDMQGNVVDANDAAHRLFERDDIGIHALEAIVPEDKERVALALQELITSGKPSVAQFTIVTKSGRVIPVEASGNLIIDAGGRPVGIVVVERDLTERKKAEAALKKSEEYFKAITENSSDIIVITDQSGTITYCSRSAERYTGYSPEELVGSSAFKFIHPDDVQQAGSAFGEAVLTKGIAIPNEFRIVHKDGSVRVFGGLGKSLFDNPAVAGFIMNIHDVTESRWAEEALRNSEEKLRVTFDSMMDSVVVSDPNLNIVDVNKASLEVLGVKTKEELIGRNAAEVIRFKDQETALSNLSRMLMERHPQIRVEYAIVLPDGRDMDVEVSTAIMHDVAGSVVGFVNVIRDVSERKKWEGALRQSEEKYRNLVEREKDVIVSVDSLGFVKSVNVAVTDWGYTQDEVLKMNFLELIAPEWQEVTARDLQTRLLEAGEYIGETVAIRKDGEKRPIEYSAVVMQEEGKYVGAQAIVRDISERKKAEESVQAKERYFRAITDLSSGAALVVNAEGTIVDVTGGLERISGHTRGGTVGRSAIEFIHPDDLKKAGAALDECLEAPGKTVTFEARLKNVQGEWQWTESMLTNLLDHPDVHGIVNHLVDVTERKKTEEEIKDHARRIEALYSVAQVISQSATLDAMLKDSLDRVCKAMDTESGCIFMLDMDENALKLKSYRGVEESVKDQFSTIPLTDEGIEKIMQVQGPVTKVDEANTVADVMGTQRVTEELGRKSLAATPLFRGNDLQGFLVVFSTRERKFSHEDLDLFKATANEISIGINNLMLLEKTREMSVTDELTGLYNRRYFFDMLDVEINRSGRTGHPFSVIMLDLDGFKEYNDKYGHSNGDSVLESFSRTLKDSVRKSDLVFRYGGDEFALILPSADAERARKIIQRARARWEKILTKQPRAVGGHVGFSSGIAEYPANAESPDGLIFLADAALYQAKRKGYEDKIVSELRTLSTNIIDVATQDQVYALAATVDARDPYTYGHSQRVADTAVRIGRAIGLSSEDLTKLHAAALLHDIGKVGVPDAILTKPGKPSPEEWDLIRKHCAEGARIVGYVKEMATLVPIVLHHHEWYDGSGYPAGLKGLEIPPGARITSVADAYDTMVTKRPYREAITSREACEELKRNAGTQFDPVIVDVWCKLVKEEEK